MEARIIRLHDGRQLSYSAYGPDSGTPTVFFHGGLGCRLMPRGEIALAEELGLRLIVPDRPGIGHSTFKPNRRLLDWPDDVAQLADALGMARFGVMGGSAGGPYTLACAFTLPERVTRAVTVCSPSPPEALGNPAEMYSPAQAETDSQSLHRDVESGVPWLEPVVDTLPSADRDSMRAFFLASLREVVRQGPHGYAEDSLTYRGRAWGFRLEDIRTPVDIFHGDADTVVSLKEAHALTDRIPNATLHVLPGVDHLVPVTLLREAYALLR